MERAVKRARVKKTRTASKSERERRRGREEVRKEEQQIKERKRKRTKGLKKRNSRLKKRERGERRARRREGSKTGHAKGTQTLNATLPNDISARIRRVHARKYRTAVFTAETASRDSGRSEGGRRLKGLEGEREEGALKRERP